MRENLAVITASFGSQIKRQTASSMWLFLVTLQPIIFTTIGYVLFQGTEEENFLLYVVLGVGMIGIWSTSLFASSMAVEFERFTGTLELIFGSPAPFELIILGKGLASSSLGIVGLGVVVLYSRAVLGIPLQLAEPFLFFLVLILTVLSLTCMGMIFGTFFALARAARAFANLLEFPLYILCGLMFPTALLPEWAYPFSAILSPTWGTQALRKAATGDLEGIWLEIAAVGALSCVYVVVAYILFKAIDVQARKTGQLRYY